MWLAVKTYRAATCAVVLAIVLPAIAACQGKAEKPVMRGGPHYFESIEAKRHMPYLPSQSISEGEALSAERTATYYKASFNEQGQLLTLQAVSKGAELWRQDVKFLDGGKQRRVVMSWPGGDSKELDFASESAR